VCPRTGLDDVDKLKFLNLLGLEIRPGGLPARSQSLYDCITEALYFCLYTGNKHLFYNADRQTVTMIWVCTLAVA
jgi:hypothetical protein